MIIKAKSSFRKVIPNLKQSFVQLNKTLVDDYEITGFIGKGSSSRVFQGYHVITKRSVIIKLFKNSILEENIKRQIRINQMIAQCPHVLPLLDAIKDENCSSYALIFPNLEGVTLNHLIGKIDFKTGLKHIKDILQALQYCHKVGVVHRDLKNSNVLITKSGAKLFDFGLSKVQGLDSFEIKKRFGTKCYFTPQAIFKLPAYTNKIDIWVCGLIMAEILSKKHRLIPYESDEATERQIVQYSGYKEEIVKNPQLKSIRRIDFFQLLKDKQEPTIVAKSIEAIKMMMNLDPLERPSASQILQLDIFNQIKD